MERSFKIYHLSKRLVIIGRLKNLGTFIDKYLEINLLMPRVLCPILPKNL